MKHGLSIKLRNEINSVMINTWKLTHPVTPQEPDFIAQLVLEGTPNFHKAISSFNNIWNSINTVGIFCHQSPKVEYQDGKSKKQCEIGDVLWCHFHTDLNGYTFRNAILFQSKMDNTVTPKISYNDTQLKLYREWPKFNYTSPKRLAGQIRDLIPKQPHAGAQYMIIDKRRPSNPHVGTHDTSILTFPIGTTSVTPKLIADTPLENELTRFLFFESGKPFDSYKNKNHSDEWTKIIWDLIRNGMERAFNRRKAGFSNSPRISKNKKDMDGMLTFTSNLKDLNNAFGDELYNEFQDIFSFENEGGDNNINYSQKLIENDESGSPSILIFITSESENKSEFI